MKKKILVAVFFLGSSVFAQGPEVRCKLSHGLPAGEWVNYTTSEPKILQLGKSITIQNKGFVLNASLEKICPQDGGPCVPGIYKLVTTITKGSISSGSKPEVGRNSYSSETQSLKVGNEYSYSQCEFNAETN